MPYTLNGIGTGYWGKGDLFTRTDVCPHCGRMAKLRSYNTTHCFVVLFLPIVPLGRRRIIDDCSICRRHRIIPLRKWQEGKRAAAEAALEACRRAPSDAEAAKAAIAAAAAYQNHDLLAQLQQTLGPSQGHNAEVQTLLGAVCAHFGLTDDAEHAYRAALRIKPDPDVGEALAGVLIENGRPDEAAPLLEHILRESQMAKVDQLYLLVRSHQARGRHRDALDLLDRIARAFPGHEADRGHRKLQRTSQKYELSGKPVGSSSLTRAVTVRPGRRGIPAAGVALLILIAAAGLYFGAAILAAQRSSVYLANGLGVPYRVEIGGREYAVPPGQPRKVTLAEGDYVVRCVSPEIELEPQPVALHTNFWSRPFVHHTVVINPDRQALLVKEKAFYSEHPTDEGSERDLYIGQPVIVFDDIDYEFAEFPDSIQISGGRVARRRCDVLNEVPPGQIATAIAGRFDAATIKDYVRTLARWGPDDETVCFLLANLFKPSEALAILRPRLDDEPVRIETHRIYQSLRQRSHDDDGLEAEYRARLAHDPDNDALVYLLARILSDGREADSLLMAAARHSNPNPYVLNSLGYRRLCNGQFEEARGYCARAIKRRPASLTFGTTEEELMSALGEFDLLEKRARENADEQSQISDVPYYLARQGKCDEAIALIDAHERRYGVGPDSFRAREDVRYACGGVDACLALYEAHPKLVGLRSRLIAGHVREAAAGIAPDAGDSAYAHLLVSLAALAVDPDLSATELRAAQAGLHDGLPEESQAAAWLAGEEPLDLDAALDLGLLPAQKRIVLTALGVRYPQHRAALFALARKLNYDRRFPYLMLREILGT